MAGFLIIILLLVFTLSLSKLTQSLQKKIISKRKNKLTKDWLLENIYDLILDKNITNSERAILSYSKQAIEHNQSYIQVAYQLKRELALLMIKQKISNECMTFYSELQISM